ncbi:hypothetical protein G3A_03510 [Bacillus sp. 17376]|jgi:hypothetical protein|nr:hypothetical protein G3A_03510 [Bacillus sp. 17376]
MKLYYDMYGSFSSALYALLFWWGVFLIFQRMTNRYPKNNSWKKDIIMTFIQSAIVLILLPILANFFRH